MKSVELYTDIQAEHGEGPIWDHLHQELYWVDIMQGRYFKADYKTGKVDAFDLGQPLGVLGLCDNDQLIMGLKNGIGFWDEKKGKLNMVAGFPQYDDANIRFNDGAVSPGGSFFAGTMTFEGNEPKGVLYYFGSERKYIPVRAGMYIPNGMGWNVERNKYFVTDTIKHTIYNYDYELVTGKVFNSSPHIIFDNDEFPDGMCMDSEDGFWVAMWGAAKVIHFDPEGKKIEEIPIPAPHPTSCCFGGPDLKTLFITTSQIALTEQEKKHYPLAGRTFFLETSIRGQIEPRFKT